MKILFIGGAGVISSACSARAIAEGHSLFLLNRGVSTLRPLPDGAELWRGDIRNEAAARRLLADHHFDVVVDWVAYTPEHIEQDIRLFSGRTDQFIFISSASAYRKPPLHLPITESTPLENPFWEYSRRKIRCEQRLMEEHRSTGFPITIVRPSHTYDRTRIPIQGRYALIERMRRGDPVLIHGDGTSLWTLTHHTDFAVGFTGLLGREEAIGEAFHITSDEVLTWDRILRLLGEAAGAEPDIVHVPSDLIAAYDPEWGAGLLGDKAHSMMFDNTKIKGLVPEFEAVVPFADGALEIVSWQDAHPEGRHRDPDETTMDRILEAYRRSWPA